MDDYICISGIGLISPSGLSVQENWERMKRGDVCIEPIRKWDPTGCMTQNFGEIRPDDDELLQSLKNPVESAKRYPPERGDILLFKAFEEAVEDAFLNQEDVRDSRTGLFIGTSLSGMTLLEKEFTRHIQNGTPIRNKTLLSFSMSTGMDRLAYEYRLQGPKFLFSTACSASLHTVIWASDYLINNEIDLAVIGGVDPMSMISMTGFSSLKLEAKNAGTPFSTKEVGVSIGEGAGVIILEKMSSLKKRGRSDCYSIVSGYHGNADAYHPTASDPKGTSIRICLENVLKNIEEPNGKKYYYVSHGTGTQHNDLVESRAVRQIDTFSDNLKVTSIKSMIGHTLGASGIVELATLAKSCKENTLLPTANFTEPRPGADLDIVRNREENAKFDVGIKSSFAFGGNNVSVSLVKDVQILKKSLPGEQSTREPVAVTGIGLVSPYNTLSLEEITERIIRGESSVRSVSPVSGYSNKKSYSRAGRIDDQFIDRSCSALRIKNHRKMDRISKISSLAAVQALKDSGLRVTFGNAYDIGLISATNVGAVESIGSFYADFLKKGAEFADAGLFKNTVTNAHAGYINLETRIKGYTTVLAQGLGSGLSAVALASRALNSGKCKAVLAGATSEYSPFFHKAVIDIGMAADEPSYYDHSTRGITPGESGAYMMLEKLDDALARNAEIYTVIDQVSVGNDHVFPGTFDYSRNPLKELFADLKDFEPDVLFGDGYGHKAVNLMESRAFAESFGSVPATSFSDYFGYVHGAAPIINTIMFSLLSSKGVIPSLLKTQNPLNNSFVTENPVNTELRRGIISTIAEGGTSGFIAVKRI